MARLRCFVHVDGVAYGPGDDLSGEVVARISNPDVWAEAPTAVAQEAPVTEAPKRATRTRKSAS